MLILLNIDFTELYSTLEPTVSFSCSQINRRAQDWADRLTASNEFRHPASHPGYNQNIFTKYTNQPRHPLEVFGKGYVSMLLYAMFPQCSVAHDPRWAVDDWGNEVRYWRFEPTQDYLRNAGHFTQVGVYPGTGGRTCK